MKSQQEQQHGLAPMLVTEILSDDLNMFRVTQQIVPRVLTQDQRDDRKSTCADLIDNAVKDGTFSIGS
jgi:hypothetical protein